MSLAASSTSSSEPPALHRRGLLGIALAATLAGCGFRAANLPPEPGTGQDPAPELAAIRLGPTYGRNGQLLHQALERRLAARDRAVTAKRYELTLSILPAFEAQGYRRDGTPTRTRMTLSVPWTLKALGGAERAVASGNARAFDSFNLVDNEFFSSVLSSAEAERRLVEQVADDIVLRLALALREPSPA